MNTFLRIIIKRNDFHPQILAILRDQEEDCERLAGSLYTKGLTQEQVGEVFEEFYADHNSRFKGSLGTFTR